MDNVLVCFLVVLGATYLLFVLGVYLIQEHSFLACKDYFCSQSGIYLGVD